MPQLPPIAPPSIFISRPLRVWLVMGLFVVYLVVGYCIFFEAIAPVANFRVQPAIAADSAAYWDASGVRTTNFASQEQAGPKASSNLFGPVLEAEILRTDLNVALFNCFLFVFCLSLLRTMPEFDRATFLLLMMINPFLLASLISLNKEIFALAGIVVFIRYTAAKHFRLGWLALALTLSLFARWQQVLVMLLYLLYESKISPLRGRRRRGIAVTVLGFTVAYGLIYRLAPFFFAALLAQAQAGHTILLLDNIQAYFGFWLVAIPKIMMNCMGRHARILPEQLPPRGLHQLARPDLHADAHVLPDSATRRNALRPEAPPATCARVPVGPLPAHDSRQPDGAATLRVRGLCPAVPGGVAVLSTWPRRGGASYCFAGTVLFSSLG